MSKPERQRFTSTFGILMSFIGVAVGLGNVWRFPYMVAAFGGGAFLLVYVLLAALFGIPALMAEFTLGRMTKRGPIGAFTKIGMKGGKYLGWLLFFTVFMSTSYYSVVVGWVLKYLWISAEGKITKIQPSQFFDQVLGGFWGQFGCTAILIFFVAVVLYWGIRRGVEKVSKYSMPLLFVLLVVLIVRALTLPGALSGLKFYLQPDFSKINFSVIAAALGQVFFSLSLGGTFLLTYASYLPDETNIKSSAVWTAVGDTAAAVFAGLFIVPAAFAFGLKVNSGPSLTFITAPSIFEHLPAGSFFAVMFFGLLFIAAFLSDVAAFEVLIATLVEEWNWSRQKAIVVLSIAELCLATISMKSLNFLLKSDLIWGSTMQPLGSAFVLIGLAWITGQQRALTEVNQGAKTRTGKIWFYWIKYIIPLGIALILAFGLKDVFHTFFRQ